MVEYEWVKELPKTAARPLSSGGTKEIVGLAEKLISTKETLKINRTTKDVRAFTTGLMRALAKLGHMPVWWVDTNDENFWYLQSRPLQRQQAASPKT